MDSIRGMFGVGIAQLMVLSVLVPAYADINDDDDEHTRLLRTATFAHDQPLSRRLSGDHELADVTGNTG